MALILCPDCNGTGVGCETCEGKLKVRVDDDLMEGDRFLPPARQGAVVQRGCVVTLVATGMAFAGVAAAFVHAIGSW